MFRKEESSGVSVADDDGSRGPSITDKVETASSSSNSLSVGKDYRDKKKKESKKISHDIMAQFAINMNNLWMQLAANITIILYCTTQCNTSFVNTQELTWEILNMLEAQSFRNEIIYNITAITVIILLLLLLFL